MLWSECIFYGQESESGIPVHLWCYWEENVKLLTPFSTRIAKNCALSLALHTQNPKNVLKMNYFRLLTNVCTNRPIHVVCRLTDFTLTKAEV